MSVAAAASRRKQAKPTKLPTTPPPTLELSAQEATKNGVERHDEEASQITSNGSRKRPSSPISIEEQFRNQLKENHLLLSNGKRFITSPEVLPTTMTTNGDAIDLSQKPQNESTEYPMFDEKTSLLFDKLSQQYILELYKTQNAQNLATISGGSSDVPSCSNSASGRTSVLSSFNENGSSFDKLYACSVENCSETFTKRGSFLWHVTSEHAAENLLQCDECEETFSDVIQLRQHRCGSAVPRPISVLPREHEELELARKAPSVPAMGECVPFHFRDEVNQMHRLEEESSTDDDDKTQINEDSSLMMGPPLLTNQLLGGLGQNQSDMSSTSMPNMGNNALDLSMSSLNNNKLNFGNNNGQFSEQAPFLAFNPMMQMRSPFDRGNPAMFMPSGMLTAPNNTNGSSSINNDDDWESMMEINTSDEAEKIRALIGDKPLPTTDPNQCIVCRRVLSCKSALQMHYRTHTGERPFKCKICQRAFTTKGNLKTHMGVHRGKPHSLRFVTGPANVGSHACPICQKRFPSSQMLQQHVAQHTNQLRAGILPPLQFDMMKPPSSEAMSATPNPFLPQHFLSSPNPANFPPFPIFPGLLNFPGANPFMNNPMNISFPMPGSEISTSMGIPSTPSTPSVPTSATPVVEVKTKIEEEKPKPASNLVNKPPTIELPPLPAMLAPKATTSSVANSGGKKVAEEKDPIKSHSEPKVTPMKPTEVPAPSSLNRFGLWKIATPEKISSISETNEQSPKKEPEIKLPGLSSPLSLLKKPVEVDKKIKSVPSSTSLASSVNSENSVITPTPKMETPTLKSELKLHEPLVTPEEGRSSDGSQSDENPLAAIEKMWAEKEPAKEASRPSMTLQKHQCGVCYKHFSSSSALQIHMRTHTGDKPFKCHVCSRAFTTRGNLKVHMTTHENQHNPSRRGRRIFDFVPDSTRLDVARQQLLASVNSAVSPQNMSPILPLLGIPSLGFPPFFSSADTIVTSPSTAVATPTTQMDAMFLLAWNMCPICQKVIANPQEKEQHFKSHLESFTANSAGISNSNNQQSTKLL